MTTTVDTTNQLPALTEAAQAKAAELLSREDRDDLMLRLSVQPGGCAGLRYQLFYDERSLDGDTFMEYDNGLVFVVDRLSLPYLMGATVDFEDSLMGAGFKVNNPNATGSCACGDSFN